MLRKLVILVTATVAIATGTGFAATLGVASHHLWAGTQTLTKATCTLSGTSVTTDTYVDESKGTSSFGTATTLQTMPDTNKRKYAFVRFDLTSCSIPATGGADTATLQLRITTAPKTSRTLTVTPITSSWSNSTTWNANPTFSSSATTTFTTGTANNVTVDVPVTIDVDDYIKGTMTNWGWQISDNGASATGDTTQLASANAGSNRPTLVINYEK